MSTGARVIVYAWVGNDTACEQASHQIYVFSFVIVMILLWFRNGCLKNKPHWNSRLPSYQISCSCIILIGHFTSVLIKNCITLFGGHFRVCGRCAAQLAFITIYVSVFFLLFNYLARSVSARLMIDESPIWWYVYYFVIFFISYNVLFYLPVVSFTCFNVQWFC